MLKRLGTVFLSLLLVLCAIPATGGFAAGRIERNVKQASAYIGQAGNSYNVYGSMMIAGVNAGAEFSIDVAKTANYHITARVSAEANSNVQAKINGSVVGEVVANTGDYSNYTEVYLGMGSLKAGTNKVTVLCTGGKMLYFSDVYLEEATTAARPEFVKTEGAYKSHFLPTTIQAEDFDLKSGKSNTKTTFLDQAYRKDSPFAITADNNGYILSLGTNESVDYTFSVSQGGLYAVHFLAHTKGKIRLFYDDNPGYVEVESKAFSETSAGNVYLEEGAHKITLYSPEEQTVVDYLRFTSGKGDYYTPADLVENTYIQFTNETEAEAAVYREFYVSPQGADSNNGSKEAPFKTLVGAKEAVGKISAGMKGDIIVNILPGTYPVTEKIEFTEKDSGRNGYRIIYRGTDAKNKPVFDGGVQITGWQQTNGEIWSAKTSGISEMRQLYINGYSAQRARSKYQYAADRPYDDPATTVNQDGAYIMKLNFPKLSNPEDMEFIFNVYWVDQRVAVANLEDLGSEYLVTYDQPYFSYTVSRNYQETQPLAGTKFYIENAPELLDEPGEFYFDKKTETVYYYPFPEEDMKTAETFVPKTEMLMSVTGAGKTETVNNLVFDNLAFRHGAWNDASRTGVEVFQADCILAEMMNSSESGTGRTLPTQVAINCANNISVTNCDFANLGSSALGLIDLVTNSTVEGNTFHDLSGTAVVVGHWRYNSKVHGLEDLSRNITVSNNVIRRTGLEYKGSPGIGVYYANSVTVSHNDLKDMPYTGITLGWGWGSAFSNTARCGNHRISNNRIDSNSLSVYDGGAIYTLSSMKNTYINGNYCSNSTDSGGIYFDQGSNNMTAFDNVIENSRHPFFAGSHIYDLYNNYCNFVDSTNNTPYNKNKGTKIIRELPIRVEKDNWGPEARAIMAQAGLTDEYKALLDGLDYPEWRTMSIKTVPKILFKTTALIERMAVDWMEGGEGVGYHEKKVGTTPKTYPQGAVHTVGDSQAGEWLAYDIHIGKTTDYTFKLHYSLAFNGTETNASDISKVSVYVDDELVLDSIPLKDTGSWTAYQGMIIGDVKLTEGDHIFKVEFVDGGFAFEKIVMFEAAQYTNEPNFDDGILFSLPQ